MKWSREASQASGEEKLEKREAFFMGLGDAVIPTVLVISANTFLNAPMFGLINIPALGAAIGTLVGYVGLMLLVLKGKPQAWRLFSQIANLAFLVTMPKPRL